MKLFLFSCIAIGSLSFMAVQQLASIATTHSGTQQLGYTNGNHYQTLDVIDDEGYYLKIQLFDDQNIGMKIILGQSMNQFSKN